jgi:peptide/nickel transport system permease protein
VRARLWAHPGARRGLVVVALLALVAVAAPFIAPYDPVAQPDLARGQLLPPSLEHPLGTDLYSRDVLSRLLYGARVSLAIAALATLVSLTVGTAVGLAAGYGRPVMDSVLMRLVDAGLAVPRVFLLLLVLALWERAGAATLILVLGFTSWLPTSRLVRAEVLSVRQRDYVAAARALGLAPWRILTRHVLPNVAAPIIVSAALGIGQIILVEAGLSFLGVGVQPPTPSWGTMIADGQHYLTRAPWLAAAPGVALIGTVVALSLVAEALQDALNPRAA